MGKLRAFVYLSTEGLPNTWAISRDLAANSASLWQCPEPKRQPRTTRWQLKIFNIIPDGYGTNWSIAHLICSAEFIFDIDVLLCTVRVLLISCSINRCAFICGFSSICSAFLSPTDEKFIGHFLEIELSIMHIKIQRNELQKVLNIFNEIF